MIIQQLSCLSHAITGRMILVNTLEVDDSPRGRQLIGISSPSMIFADTACAPGELALQSMCLLGLVSPFIPIPVECSSLDGILPS